MSILLSNSAIYCLLISSALTMFTKQLEKLQEYYDDIKKPNGCKWKDHSVSGWEQIEEVKEAIQNDTYVTVIILLQSQLLLSLLFSIH